jgi:cytochrome d ubiquinol oxidase subunit I
MHFVATSVVAFGTVLSAFWILSVNSWMQTPAGFEIRPNGIFEPTDWLQVVFNPSFIYRFSHMLMGAYLTTAFFVGSVGAFILLHNKKSLAAQIMLAMATLLAAIVTPLQILAGDLHGLNTLEHQPLKVAAMEGIWENEKGAGLRLFAWPNQEQEKNHFEVKIPYLTSLILTHSWDGEVVGLKHWHKEDRPPVIIIFWAFRVMVGVGFLMLITGLSSAAAFLKGKLYEWRPLHYLWIMMGPAGFIAILSGWFVTEVGRQPFLVYGHLRTKEMLTPSLKIGEVTWSLASFLIIYSFVFGAGVFYMAKVIRKKLSQEIRQEPS